MKSWPTSLVKAKALHGRWIWKWRMIHTMPQSKEIDKNESMFEIVKNIFSLIKKVKWSSAYTKLSELKNYPWLIQARWWQKI